MFGWNFASFGNSKPCYMYFHYLSLIFFFFTTQCHVEYAAPILRGTI